MESQNERDSTHYIDVERTSKNTEPLPVSWHHMKMCDFPFDKYTGSLIKLDRCVDCWLGDCWMCCTFYLFIWIYKNWRLTRAKLELNLTELIHYRQNSLSPLGFKRNNENDQQWNVKPHIISHSLYRSNGKHFKMTKWMNINIYFWHLKVNWCLLGDDGFSFFLFLVFFLLLPFWQVTTLIIVFIV